MEKSTQYKSMQQKSISFDELVEHLGAFGSFQRYAFVLMSLFSLWMYHGVSTPFIVFQMEHWCYVEELAGRSWEEQRYIGIPYLEGEEEGEYEECYR